MASFQASAATSPRANVINSANLSNTSALNFYSSLTSCTSFDFCGHARSMQAETRVYTLTQIGERAILPNLHLQRIAMILTRMHATGTCLAATLPRYTAPNQDS